MMYPTPTPTPKYRLVQCVDSSSFRHTTAAQLERHLVLGVDPVACGPMADFAHKNRLQGYLAHKKLERHRLLPGPSRRRGCLRCDGRRGPRVPGESSHLVES